MSSKSSDILAAAGIVRVQQDREFVKLNKLIVARITSRSAQWRSTVTHSFNTLCHTESPARDKTHALIPPVSLLQLKPNLTPFEIAHKVADVLEQLRIEFAISGALALSYHSLPRTTFDVDVNVWIDLEEIPKVLHAMHHISPVGFLDEEGAPKQPLTIHQLCEYTMKQSRETGLLRFVWYDTLVQMFLPITSDHISAAKHSRQLGLPDMVNGKLIPVVSPQTIALMKLLFFRPKDKADLENLIVGCHSLDASAVLTAIRRLMEEGVMEFVRNEDRVVFWQELCKKYNKPLKHNK